MQAKIINQKRISVTVRRVAPDGVPVLTDTDSKNSIRQNAETANKNFRQKNKTEYSFSGRNSKTANKSLPSKVEQMESKSIEKHRYNCYVI